MAREIVIDLANYQANLSVQDYKKLVQSMRLLRLAKTLIMLMSVLRR